MFTVVNTTILVKLRYFNIYTPKLDITNLKVLIIRVLTIE